MRYSVEPRDWIIVKVYGIFFLAKNKGKNISQKLSVKYSQKRLDHANKVATDSL